MAWEPVTCYRGCQQVHEGTTTSPVWRGNVSRDTGVKVQREGSEAGYKSLQIPSHQKKEKVYYKVSVQAVMVHVCNITLSLRGCVHTPKALEGASDLLVEAECAGQQDLALVELPQVEEHLVG